MKLQIALTALILALISSTVFAQKDSGGHSSRCNSPVSYNIFVAEEPPLLRTPLVSLVKDSVTETLDALHGVLKADLNEKIELTINRSLQAGL